ncbi:hypothetical protein GUITHDRAFT_118441 [Guillardia theta CCMP2712]|uniref:Uncharacterized protein n=1 Tax=Guillardia theta (strain CCMP2712) TaxID=905079 RepID=L1IHM0_GUITC|nr:hypothetical protein GUITHDRAFT_118441 [Guillardia theta CCMP2712]EKX35424.1 hypothetical protein GUITHDRAFT_118441 [Guillardia theta CCMP2712]|eukprot:XP_005822404.1 hypothetical protein GUITHDRAFT_118441 [Guillardia theta CCMP2712]
MQDKGNAQTNIRKKALTPALAADIFSQRSLKPGYATVESSFVAKKYGVSSKTIRDIWSRRTWTEATRPLWTADEIESTGTEPATRLGSMDGGSSGSSSPKDCKAERGEDGSKQATGSRSSETSARGSSKGSMETSSGTSSCTRRLEADDSPPEGSSSPGSGLEPQASTSSCSSSAGCREKRHRYTAKRNKTVSQETEEAYQGSEEAASGSSNELKEPSSDSESSKSCPSPSLAGGKRRASRRDGDQKKEAQGESRKRLRRACTREGKESLVDMLLSQRMTGRQEAGCGMEPANGRRMEGARAESPCKKEEENDCGGEGAAAEILGLLRRLTKQQDEILELQQVMLENLYRSWRALA